MFRNCHKNKDDLDQLDDFIKQNLFPTFINYVE